MIFNFINKCIDRNVVNFRIQFNQLEFKIIHKKVYFDDFINSPRNAFCIRDWKRISSSFLFWCCFFRNSSSPSASNENLFCSSFGGSGKWRLLTCCKFRCSLPAPLFIDSIWFLTKLLFREHNINRKLYLDLFILTMATSWLILEGIAECGTRQHLPRVPAMEIKISLAISWDLFIRSCVKFVTYAALDRSKPDSETFTVRINGIPFVTYFSPCHCRSGRFWWRIP